MRTKHTFRLPTDLASKLADYANRKGVTQALVVEAALASHLSPDGADRLEAALARRLDRITRHLERIERRLARGGAEVPLHDALALHLVVGLVLQRLEFLDRLSGLRDDLFVLR